MNRIFLLFAAFVAFGINIKSFAQAPGGVAAGLTVWYQAEAGTTVSPANVLTSWANQATNPNLTNLTPEGGATTLVSNNPVPFNFHSYLQHAAGCMRLANSVANTDVVATTQGSMMGVGTASDQLICLAGNSTSGQFGANRANTGIRNGNTQFGSGTTAGNANFAAGTVLNTGNANIFGLRALVGATPAQQNTFNGLKATGAAATRPAGSYRFAVGSFIGFFYGTNKSAEAICHNRQLTPDEFSRVESYLAVKYGVTLGTSATPVDYLSSASTIIWTGDAAYQNNITGICRDDASGLIQKQSRAVTAKSKVFIFNDNTGGVFPAMNVDNTTTFAADQSFVLFGDNNGDTVLNVCAMDGKAVRINRHWKMVKTGAAGDVTIAFTATELPADVTTLLVSTNNTFPEASTIAIPLTTSGTYKYAVIPSANTFFTFSATPLDISVNVVNLTCQATNGGSMTATATGGLAPVSYQWNTTPPQNTATATNVPAGNYTVTVTQAAGCAYTQNATMANNIIDLTATLTATDVKCNGDANGTITVNNTNGTPAFSYSLNNQGNWVPGNQFQNLSTGLYRVYLKDANGCTGDDTISIHEPNRLSLQFKNVINDYCEIGSEPNGNVEILLTGGTAPYNVTLNGSNIPPSLKLTNLKEDDYAYAVTDANGCTTSGNFSIEHVPCCFAFVPNAFTPNMDSKNDIFRMETTGRIRVNSMIVYNRYGQIVWSTFNQGEGWDGTQNGKPVDVGTYFYYIKYTCESVNGPKETELKGDVTVIR
jgi:gliding motility-associated-like protein